MQETLFELERPQLTSQTLPLGYLEPDENLIGTPSAGMVESLRSYGLIYPINVQLEEGADLYRVLDGARRVRAARQLAKVLSESELEALRLDPIPCLVVPRCYARGEALTLIANYHREENPVRDFAALQKLLLTPGATLETVAATLRLKVSDVKDLCRLLELTSELQDAYREGKIKTSVALQVARWTPERQQQVVTHLETEKRFTGPDLKVLASASAQQQILELPFDQILDPNGAAPDPPVHRLSPEHVQRAQETIITLRTTNTRKITRQQLDAAAALLEKILNQ